MTIDTKKVDATVVAASLPEKWFVRRGHVMAAFRLTRNDVGLMIVDGRKMTKEEKTAATEQGRFVAEYLPGDTRARFVRARCIRVAQVLEGTNFPKT